MLGKIQEESLSFWH